MGQSEPPAAIMYVDFTTPTASGHHDPSPPMELVEKERQLLHQSSEKHGGKGSKLTSDKESEIGLKGWLKGSVQKERVSRQGSHSVLVFKNSLDAVRCAIDFQHSLNRHNRAVAKDLELHVGIGIHNGQFEVRGEEISGEALNIVSRIWPLGGPGGICITGSVKKEVGREIQEIAIKLDSDVEGVTGHSELYKLVPGMTASEKKTEELSQRRIAVLPFVSFSSDPQDEFFADGLTEELIDRLAQARELEVIARTSIMVFKKKEKRAGEIGRELKAGALVEGSVRKAGNKIRVTAQLVDANTEGHLWSSRYDKDLEDIFAVQSDIAQQVAEALRVRLLPSEKRVIEKEATQNMHAYELYLKGRHYWNERTETSVRRGIEYLKQAIEEDPQFATAYSDLANCYVIMADYSMLDASEARALTLKYANKALEIDTTLSQPHVAIATMLDRNFDWEGGEKEYKRAIELNPNNVTAHHWYGLSSLFRGRKELSLHEFSRARELDPLSLIVNGAYGAALVVSGKHKEGVDMLEQILELDHNFAVTLRNLCLAYVFAGKFAEATRTAEKLEVLRPGLGYLGYSAWVFAMTGRKEDAARILNELLEAGKTHYLDPAVIAMIYAALRDENRAIDWLQSAVEKKSAAITYVNIVPAFDSLRTNPRFKMILERIGLA